MNKIFEKRQMSDGGPMDRGICIGFIKAKNEKEAKEILNINHNFIELREISKKEFLQRKKEALENYRMYKL